MNKEYTWNLQDIYEFKIDIEKDIEKFKQKINELEKYKGKLSTSCNSNTILEMYKNYEEVLMLEEKIYGYSMLNYHKDMANDENIKLYKEVKKLVIEFSKKTSYIDPEISSIEESVLIKYLEENEQLRNLAGKALNDIIKNKKHILSKKEEKILATYDEILSSMENTYDILTNVEFEFPSIKDSIGDIKKVTLGTFSKLLTSKDECVRRQAFESMYAIYGKHIKSITELYINKVKVNTITSNVRKYKSSLENSTKNDDSSILVVDTLVEQTNKNLNLNHRYLELKKQLLGKEKMNIYDVYVNMLDIESEKIEYDNSKKIVLKSLEPLGKKYLEKIEYALENRWIDVFEEENKMSGGYSMGIYGIHPYILLNYAKSIRDVSTLAHELGHTMHSYLSNKNQNIYNSNYTIMVAEVASTVNEILLANYLIDNEKDENKKMMLINEELDTIRATIFRQTMFTEFEKEVHEKIENKKILTDEELNKIYFNLNKKYFGESVTINEEIKYEWSRIPHFYRCFYVYKYATGMASAIAIAKNILTKKEGYVEKYLEMLSSGGKIGSLDLLKMVDVDLENKDTYKEAFEYFNEKLTKLEELVKKQGKIK